jgi:hypothetical protein
MLESGLIKGLRGSSKKTRVPIIFVEFIG